MPLVPKDFVSSRIYAVLARPKMYIAHNEALEVMILTLGWVFTGVDLYNEWRTWCAEHYHIKQISPLWQQKELTNEEYASALKSFLFEKDIIR
jgi:hypothetical protein